MRERDEETKSRFTKPHEVADFWNIAHLISVGNPDDWKLAFTALMQATILLDKQNSSMVQLEQDKLDLIKMVEELNQKNFEYFKALEEMAYEFDVDILDYINLKD